MKRKRIILFDDHFFFRESVRIMLEDRNDVELVGAFEDANNLVNDIISSQPDLVLMPSLGDIHQDHETIAREGMRAFKRTTLLGYEIPWNCFQFQQQAYVSLEPRHLERKCAALKRYESQQHRNYANEEYIRNVARTHGIVSGRDMAEVFEVYRWIL